MHKAPYLHRNIYNTCGSLHQVASVPVSLQHTTVCALKCKLSNMGSFQTNCFFRRSFLLGIPTPGAPPTKESFIAKTPVVSDADTMHAAPLAVLPLYNCSAVDLVSTLRANKALCASALVDTYTASTIEARDGTLACNIFSPISDTQVTRDIR